MNGNDTVGCSCEGTYAMGGDGSYGGGCGCEGVNRGGCGCGGIVHVGHDTDDCGCEGTYAMGGDGSYGGGHCFGNALYDVDFEDPSRTDLLPVLICSLRSSSLIDIGHDSS